MTMTITIHPDAAQLGLELPSVRDMREAIEKKHREELAEQQKKAAAAAEEKNHQREAFLASHLTPDWVSSVIRRVRNAAEGGATEIKILKFPSAWCTDGGRKINVLDPSWPETLQGFAREFYEFWASELKPRGFHLHVQIVDFPGGMPGDVCAFLSWNA
jgi:hypothetical protein